MIREMANVIQFGELQIHTHRTWKHGRRIYNGGAVLGRTTHEKDLGVTFSADIKVSEQCGIAASKGNKILGLIRSIRRTIM